MFGADTTSSLPLFPVYTRGFVLRLGVGLVEVGMGGGWRFDFVLLCWKRGIVDAIFEDRNLMKVV